MKYVRREGLIVSLCFRYVYADVLYVHVPDVL